MGLSQRQSGGHESAAIRRLESAAIRRALSQQRSGGPAGIESEAGRRALSQRRSGGVISREWRAWGSGNPGTRQPAVGLRRATAGGGYLLRSAGMRASRPLDSRRSRRTPTPSCSGLWRDYERRLPCRGTDTNKQTGTKQKTFENGKQNGVNGHRLRFRSGLLSRCTHEGETGTRRRGLKLK